MRRWAKFLVLPLAGILNRLRGGGAGFHDAVPGRGLYYIAVVIGLLTWALHSWPVGLALGATFLVWGIPGWGRWIGLGRHTVDRDSLTIRTVERIAFRLPRSPSWTFYHNALLVRMSIVVPPLWAIAIWQENILLVLLAPSTAFLFVLCYEVAWRLGVEEHSWRHPIPLAEKGVGVTWGLIILILVMGP